MKRTIHKVISTFGSIASWLTTALVLLVCFDVVRRYLFKYSTAWTMELEWHLFAIIFLFGAAFTYSKDKHVRVDLFYEKYSNKDKQLTNAVGNLFFLIPWCIVLIYVSWNYAYSSFEINESSPDPGGLPARYLIKFCIPLAFGLLLLQGILDTYNNLKPSPRE